MSKVLSAVAWPYANGPRHIGHVAGFGVPSDVFSRYMRMAGPRRAHGLAAPTSTARRSWSPADEEGVTAAASWPTRNNRVIVEDLVGLGLSYDLFTRTTTRNHYAVVQEMFRTVHAQRLHGRADHARARSRPSTGRTLPDRYIEGTCPICGYDERPRRPVRQLRQPARPDRPDQPAQQDQRRDAGVRRDPALLPRPAGAGRRAGGVARRARGVAAPGGPTSSSSARTSSRTSGRGR